MADDASLIALYRNSTATIPASLTIKPYGNNSVYLSWTSSSNLDYSYNVYMAYTKDLVFEKIGQTSGLYFIVNDLNYNNDYHFSVSSNYYDNNPIPSGGTIESYPSGLIPPFALSTVQVNNVSGYGVQIYWTEPSGFMPSGYRVWRTTNWNSEFSSIGSTKNTTYIDSGLIEKQIYYYRVSSLG